MLLTCVANELVLFKRQRQRLLAKNVFSGQQGLDRNLDVPMIGSRDADHIDVAAIKQLAIVAVDIRLALANAFIILCSFGVLLVNIGDRHDVSETGVPFAVTATHTAKTDAANDRPIVL